MANNTPQITILGLFKNMAIMRVNGVKRVLKQGQVSPEGIKLVSATSHGAVLELNGQQQRFKLGQDRGGVFKVSSKAKVTIYPDQRGMYRKRGSINGIGINFMVDTGATDVAMNSQVARKLRMDYKKVGQPGRYSTANGMVVGYRVKLDKVKLGDIELYKVDAAVLEGNFPQEVLLGNSFLNRINMKREGAAMILQK